jgi:phosphoribosylformylglycinamidine synthase subunit PurQ / glutaminase
VKFGVVVFPDFESGKTLIEVLNHVIKVPTTGIWHKNALDMDFDALFISGGTQWLSYVDEDNIEKKSPVISRIREYAANGGYIFGSGEGFRLLCNLKLLDGNFELNKTNQFIHKNVYIRVDNAQSAITSLVNKNSCLKLPIATQYGKYVANESELSAMRQNNQILFRFCDDSCKISEKNNFTGSVDNIAAICNTTANIFGILPYPERACEDIMGNTDGRYIFESILAWIK